MSSLGGLEPPTFRLTAERANQLRHRDNLELHYAKLLLFYRGIFFYRISTPLFKERKTNKTVTLKVKHTQDLPHWQQVTVDV